MALTNKQKRTIIDTAKANGYKGDYTSLFNQAESEQVFNNTAPGIPVPQLTKEDINFAEADDYKFNPKSLLVDRTPHRFNDNDNFITSDHSVKPNNKSILRFLNDPEYTPTAEPNMGANGGLKKYDEGGTPHDHPHPTTDNETETETIPVEETMPVETTDEVQTRRRPRNPYGAAGNYNQYLKSEEYGPSQLNNTLKMQRFLGLEPDGTFGDSSKAKMLTWSNKNLSSLPVYDPNFKTMNIKCSGKECSGQTTNTLQLLYPQLDRDQLDPDHSWYRRDRILKNGGTDLWSQDVENINTNSIDERSDFTGIPPMDVWNTFQVGDIVSMDSRYRSRDSDEIEEDNGQVYDGAEHTGFIIGRDPETGIPLVMHGYAGKMEVDALNNISLGNPSSYNNPDYIISGVSRPKAVGDGENNNFTFDKLNFFLEKDDFATHNTFAFDEDYLTNMNEKELAVANQFANFFNGSTRKRTEGVYDEDGRYVENNTHEVLNQNDSLTQLALTSSRSIRFGESKFGGSYPIQKIANITGYSKDEVSKAAMLTWGFYQNETGDAQGIREGKGMEWIKDNMSTKNAAKLKALKNGDITWTPKIYNFLDFEVNEEKYMYSAKQEPSKGILRIKYNMQTKNGEGKTTRVGSWARSYGIYGSEDLISEDDKENSLITGVAGTEGIQNSFAMGTLLTLSYYENIRRKEGYDPETETYKGVPIDYVVATMHKGLNLNSQAGDGNTILKNLQRGDRSYSNVTINNANKLSYTKTTLDTKYLEENRPVEAILDAKTISSDNYPFKSSINFINDNK